MEYGDTPFFKDGLYIYSTGQVVNESDVIEGTQSLDNLDTDQLEEMLKQEK